MTPEEQQQLHMLLDRLNKASEEFRLSRDALKAAALAFIEANDRTVASIDHVLSANGIALRLLNPKDR